MPSPTKLDSIVAQNSLLRQLFREAADQRTVNDRIIGAIDETLRAHVRFAIVRGSTLVLIADSSAWASKLRYQVGDIQRRIAGLSGVPPISNIRVKVAAAAPPPAPEPRRAQVISAEAAVNVREQAQSITDPRLREVMLKLVGRGEQ